MCFFVGVGGAEEKENINWVSLENVSKTKEEEETRVISGYVNCWGA